MLWSLAIAGVFALAVFGTTRAVVVLQRHETAAANKELEEYKLSVEGKVADAKKEGIEAGRIAGNALVRQAELERETARLAAEAEASKAQTAIAQADAARANERTAALAVELEAARVETARADAILLQEQRLNARERMRLARLERAVLPRVIPPEAWSTLVPLLSGLGPVNIAISQGREPRGLGLQFLMLFQQAGIMGRLIWLPTPTPPADPQGGVTMIASGEVGERIARLLWTTAGYAGGVLTGNIRPIGLEAVPLDENTLVIGENDAAMQATPGQDGEGVDENGRPVPMPR